MVVAVLVRWVIVVVVDDCGHGNLAEYLKQSVAE